MYPYILYKHKCLHTLYTHEHVYTMKLNIDNYDNYDKICPDVQRNQMQYLIIQLHTYILQFIYIHTYTS